MRKTNRITFPGICRSILLLVFPFQCVQCAQFLCALPIEPALHMHSVCGLEQFTSPLHMNITYLTVLPFAIEKKNNMILHIAKFTFILVIHIQSLMFGSNARKRLFNFESRWCTASELASFSSMDWITKGYSVCVCGWQLVDGRILSNCYCPVIASFSHNINTELKTSDFVRRSPVSMSLWVRT